MLQGRIVGNIANLYLVECSNQIFECSARGKLKKEAISPVVGDLVQIQKEGETNKAVIEEILPRINYSKRPKLANITQLLFVISTKMPKPDLLILDKQLCFAEYLGIKAVIIINKIDLEKKQAQQIQKIYEKIGYQVILTNAKKGIGKEEVKLVLQNEISAFSGNSGVGKSTLINQIFEEYITQEGMISQKNKRGKNTTTDSKLYPLEKGGYLADTPGFSTFSIEEIETKQLDEYFIEIRNKKQECEFIGCTHIKEQECAVRKAVQKEEIAESRYQNYCKIYNELKEKEAHKW